jgi:hypothetical protein
MALVLNESVNHHLIQKENKGPPKVSNKRFTARVCYSHGFWNMSGDGNASSSLAMNTTVVFPCLVISPM